MSIPFYGGINGQSFKITCKFSTFSELKSDADQGWSSSKCMVGDYVVIDYGSPNSEEFAQNKATDADGGYGYQNATVWQKIYTETLGADIYAGANGIGYKCLFHVSRPPFGVQVAEEPLKPGEEPTVEASTDGDDYYTFTFGNPKAWGIDLGTKVVLAPDQDPDVTIADNAAEDTKIITFSLPRSQDIQDEGEVSFTKTAGSGIASITLDKESSGASVAEPILKLELPAMQSLVQDAITPVPIGPTGSYSATVSYDEEDTLHEHPKIAVSIPRAVRLIFGTHLKMARNAALADSDLSEAEYNTVDVGDYYVNKALAAVHQIASKDVSTKRVTTVYQGTFQQAVPVPSVQGIAPYEVSAGAHTLVTPRVTADPTAGPVESWQMKFELPDAPDLTLNENSGIVGSLEEGQITPTYSTTGLDFLIQIPRGTRIYVEDSTEDVDTDTVKTGDLCLIKDHTAADYGKVYKWNGTEWILDTDLRGPVGKALNIAYPNVEVTSSDAANTLAAVSAYLESQSIVPQEDELVSVLYKDLVTTDELAYWYYRDQYGTWGRSLITGNLSGLTISSYTTAPEDQNKAYSVSYVNTLVARISALETALAADIEQQQSWGRISDLNNA